MARSHTGDIAQLGNGVCGGMIVWVPARESLYCIVTYTRALGLKVNYPGENRQDRKLLRRRQDNGDARAPK